MNKIQEAYLDIVKQSLMGTLDTKSKPNWQFSFQSDQDFKRLMTNGCIRTLIGQKRLDNIQQAINYICQNQIEGDILEAGCWRGGALLYAKACLNIYDTAKSRLIYGADLFPQKKSYVSKRYRLFVFKLLMRFLPVLPQKLQNALVNYALEAFPNEEYTHETKQKIRFFCCHLSYIPASEINSTGYEDVIEVFKRYNLYDQNVNLVPGWFEQTFPALEKQVDKLSLLRIDADFYQSTLHTLTTFYPKLSEGGICIIDDYGGFDECKRAVDEYRAQYNINTTMHSVDGVCYYWFHSFTGTEYTINQAR